ncbi:hypothetical protein SASPL_147078 [Salvia splendens]|uniref:Demeter RRM-fold domain-containing protein n=1 Tax=Salvia splendens TaxID=180675 RepID=A0A8X8WD10_SALSN|nr:hypothetical protein SASPL_147078 [Salvia splendens]
MDSPSKTIDSLNRVRRVMKLLQIIEVAAVFAAISCVGGAGDDLHDDYVRHSEIARALPPPAEISDKQIVAADETTGNSQSQCDDVAEVIEKAARQMRKLQKNQSELTKRRKVKLESIQLGFGDACPCLLAVWTRENLEKDGCIPEEDAVYGTLLIPARAATGGAFPLNGTFFQSNELFLRAQVFADAESSAVPIKVPRASLTDLSSTTLYCGTNTSSICKG